MSDIEQLRRRVEAAERHFGTIGEQQGKYSERLIHLMDQIERRGTERESEINRYLDELQQLRRDHEQVKAMLQALLAAIEAGGGDALMSALREMDRKASALVGQGPASEMPFAAKGLSDEEVDLDGREMEIGALDDFQNGFEDVAPDMLATEEFETDDETGIEAIEEGFEDVTPETLAAEEAEEAVGAVSDEIVPETAPAEMAIEIPAQTAAAASPVAGIIQRIGQLTRELAEQPLPARAPAAPAELSGVELRRIAS
jgi:chromosome segregation ATPase